MSENSKSVAKGGMRITWRGIVLIIIAVLLLVFAVQNLESAPVSFLGVDFSVPVWLLVVVTFALGMLLGGVVRGAARGLRKPKVER
jgi:uncharacterized integral membrane protein